MKTRKPPKRKAFIKVFSSNLAKINMIFSLAWRTATRSKYRTFLLLLGIILTVTLETGIVVCVDTLYDDFLLDHRNNNRTDITVNPIKWINQTKLDELAEEIQQTSGVAKASSIFYYHAPDTNILLLGIDPESHPDFPHLKVTSGAHHLTDQIIMVSQDVYNMIPINVGGSITWNMIESFVGEILPKDFSLISSNITLGGVFSDETFANKLGFQFILVDIDTLLNSIPEAQQINLLTSEIDVSVDDFLDIQYVGETIEDTIGLGYYVFIEKDISEIKATGIRAYQSAMNLVIIVSFFVEFLFITNILAIAINDRQKEFGTLRAVGTGSKQLIQIILTEVLIYSIIGCTIGILAGISFSTFLIGLMSLFYESLEFQSISIHPSSIIATFLSGIFVASISGLYPIFLAVSMPVIQNIHSRMRTSDSSITRNRWKYTIGVGLLTAITGFLLQFFIGPSRFLDFSIISIHFLVVILIFLGTVILEIGILFFLPRIAMKTLFWFSVITRTISTRNISREFSKSLITIITSALALSFIIIVGLTSTAVISNVPGYFEDQWGGIDLVAETRDSTLLPTNFTQVLNDRSDINQSSFIQEARTEIGEIDGYVYGIDPFKWISFSELIVDSIDNQEISNLLNKTSQTVIIENTATTKNVTYGVISHLLYKRLSSTVSVGSNVSIKINNNNTVNVTIAAVIRGNTFLGNGEYLYIASSRFRTFFNSNLAKWFVCNIHGNAGTVQIALERTYDELKNVIGITFFKEVIERSLEIQTALFQVLFLESFILAAITQFVCILISTLRMEREVGMMRSLGLQKRGVFGIFLAESTSLGIAALAIGLFNGLLGSFLLIWYISLSIPIAFQFPIDQILLWSLFSFLITLISTIMPSYRSSQKNIVAAISGRPMAKSYHEIEPFTYDVKKFHPIWSEIPQESRVETDSESSSKTTVSTIITSFWEFLWERELQIQTCILFLMALVTIIYIFDENIIIKGLLPFDFIWRSIFQIIFSETINESTDSFQVSFFIVNPLLLMIGLISIGPFTYYLAHGSFPKSLMKNSIRSILYGSIGITGFIIFSLLGIFLVNFVIMFISSFAEEYIYYYSGSFSVLIIGLGILLIFFALLILQRLWAFLILQGVYPDLPLRVNLSWIRKSASKGQLGFILFVFLHLIVQSILFISLQPISIEYGGYRTLLPDSAIRKAPPVDPLTFLILTSFEIGFFLFFILYQLVQWQKQNFEGLMKNSDGLGKGDEKSHHINIASSKETPISQRSSEENVKTS
ncbi:MAG: ABC transporter permease [Candidatus Hodarchaeales archaeon]|jgi:putative ABC transport system permease protein